jgi:hypothetical protein
VLNDAPQFGSQREEFGDDDVQELPQLQSHEYDAAW